MSKKNAGNSNVSLQSWPGVAVLRGEAGPELPWMVELQTVAGIKTDRSHK